MDAYRAGVGAFPLLLAAVGERVRVVGVHGGSGAGRKLLDLGLTPGCEVTVASRGGGQDQWSSPEATCGWRWGPVWRIACW